MNSKTQFRTDYGTTSVSALSKASVKTEAAQFELTYKLGLFGLWCKEKGKAVSDEFAALAKAAGFPAHRIASLQSQVSYGVRLVKSGATFEEFEQFTANITPDAKGNVKLTTEKGVQVRGGVESFSAYKTRDIEGGKVAKMKEASSGKVLDKEKAVDAAESEAQKKGAAPAPDYATQVKGNGVERVTITAPVVMTATAKANLREAIEAHCKASDISLESVFPELAKVNA